MSLYEKILRIYLKNNELKARSRSIEASRKRMERLGRFVYSRHKNSVGVNEIYLGGIEAADVIPKSGKRNFTILYLHGGGYVNGGYDYAKGMASLLSDRCGARVLAPAYRLAPEAPFPAALDDAVAAYEYLRADGCSPSDVVFFGESAGGGLCYALCLKLGERGEETPAGIVTLSPWTDLTSSGASYKLNEGRDPSMSWSKIKRFCDCYSSEHEDPLVSPLFGDLYDMPPSLIFVGGDEMLLDDATSLHEKLIFSGRESELVVAEHMWHAYLFYGVRARNGDFRRMTDFMKNAVQKRRETDEGAAVSAL